MRRRQQISSNGEKPEQRADTPVGYCNPPESTRFKKGQSGNPKGRPKGTLNVATVFARTSREKVVINENGERKTVTKLEAAIKQLVNKAASGDLRALRQLFELAREAEAQENTPRSENPVIKESDQEVISGLLRRFQREREQGPEQESKNHDDQRR